MNTTCINGTILKINVHIERICCLTMDDFDFECDFFVYPNKKFTLKKSEMVRKNEDNYMAVVDTSVVGEGEIKVRATALLPDDDCPDGFRKELAECSTGITVKR